MVETRGSDEDRVGGRGLARFVLHWAVFSFGAVEADWVGLALGEAGRLGLLLVLLAAGLSIPGPNRRMTRVAVRCVFMVLVLFAMRDGGARSIGWTALSAAVLDPRAVTSWGPWLLLACSQLALGVRGDTSVERAVAGALAGTRTWDDGSRDPILAPGLLGLRTGGMALAIVLGAAIARRDRSNRVRVLVLAALVIAVTGAAAVAARIGADPYSSTALAIRIGAGTVAALIAARVASTHDSGWSLLRAGAPRIAVLHGALVAGIAGVAVIASMAPTPSEQGLKGLRVGFLNEGGLDWERPQLGHLGPWSNGMFGLLPHFLSSSGAEVVAVEAEGRSVANRDLEELDALVVINCPRRWTDGERARLRSWIAEGHHLLVLADHTDVFGCQAGVNSLIEPLGATLRFDSAYHAGPAWFGEVRSDPRMGSAPRGWAWGHAIGASIRTDSSWTGILRGPYGFSDEGYRWNIPGSFLGNYAWEPGEVAGEMVLAARRSIGCGTVIVYGDTTAFQNSVLPWTYLKHVGPLFREFRDHGEPGHRLERRAMVGFLFLVCLSWVLALASVCGASATLSCMAAAGSLFVTSSLVQMRQNAFDRPADLFPSTDAQEQLALFDLGVDPWLGFGKIKYNGVGAAFSTCSRVGLIPLVCDLGYAQPSGGALVVYVDPLRVPSARELSGIRAFVEGGGTLLLFCGGDHEERVRGLLTEFGVGLVRAALGGLEVGGDSASRVRLREAWELVDRRKTPETGGSGSWMELIRREDRIHAIAVGAGDGHFVVVADPRFLSSPNLEGMWGYDPGNIGFLAGLLVQFANGRADRLPEYFGSPEKPQ